MSKLNKDKLKELFEAADAARARVSRYSKEERDKLDERVRTRINDAEKNLEQL